MKSATQIIAYIDAYYDKVTLYPTGFFRDVLDMETRLAAFEALYEFIVSEPNEPVPNQFFNFLVANGYGALGFSRGKVEEFVDEPSVPGPPLNEVEKMMQFGQFWRRYLVSDFRLRAK